MFRMLTCHDVLACFSVHSGADSWSPLLVQHKDDMSCEKTVDHILMTIHSVNRFWKWLRWRVFNCHNNHSWKVTGVFVYFYYLLYWFISCWNQIRLRHHRWVYEGTDPRFLLIPLPPSPPTSQMPRLINWVLMPAITQWKTPGRFIRKKCERTVAIRISGFSFK